MCATQLLQSNFHGNDASLDLEIFRDVVMDEGTLRVHQVELVVNARPGAQTTILVTRMGSHFAGWLLLEVPRRRNIIRSLHYRESCTRKFFFAIPSQYRCYNNKSMTIEERRLSRELW